MPKKLHLPFALLIIFSFILGACATPTAAPPAVAPTEAVVVQPTEAPPPTAAPVEAPALDAEALFASLVDSMPADKGFGAVSAVKLSEELASGSPHLVDVREAAEVEKDGFIEGAIHIPIRDLLDNLDKLPGQDEPIVVYCASGHRGGLALASLKLLGYSDVRNLGGGLGAWKKADLPVVTGEMPAEAAVLGRPAIADEALLTLLDGFLGEMPDSFYSVKADALGEALATDAPPALIDVRTVEEWDKDGYIEGAVNIPFNEFFASLDQLPAPDEPMVVYCGSGHRGAIVMMALRMMGYSDVTNLGGGLGAWKAAQMPVAGWVDWTAAWTEFMAPLPQEAYYTITAAALNTLLVDNPPFLLDIRETAEIEKDGFIAGAVNIPVRDLLKNLDKLPALDEPIVVYCASGHRGGMALAALRLLGYSNAVDLAGGLGAWKNAEFPVETDLTLLVEPAAGAMPEVDAARLSGLDAFLSELPEGFYSVKPADLNAELGGAAPPVVVDVRAADEIAQGYIEGSLPIPIEGLLAGLGELPDKSAPIVVLCQSGHRGAIGLMALRMLGYTDVRNLAGGINGWLAAELPLAN